MGSDIPGDAVADEAGYSVSLSDSGERVAVGAYKNQGVNGEVSGHVKVYEYNEHSNPKWVKMGSDIDGDDIADYSGRTISLNGDGTIVAIGAHGNNAGFPHGSSNDDRGHVKVYKYNDPNWTQIGSDIDGDAGNLFSGFSVSLSKQGNKVAIGTETAGRTKIWQLRAPNENGDYQWVELGTITGNDRSGRTLSLSGNGNVLALGAYFYPDGKKKGKVTVYDIDN